MVESDGVADLLRCIDEGYDLLPRQRGHRGKIDLQASQQTLELDLGPNPTLFALDTVRQPGDIEDVGIELCQTLGGTGEKTEWLEGQLRFTKKGKRQESVKNLLHLGCSLISCSVGVRS